MIAADEKMMRGDGVENREKNTPVTSAVRPKPRKLSIVTINTEKDVGRVKSYLSKEGVTLPVHIGIPGVAEPHRLLAIAARIGVADTHRFLSKNVRFVARMLRSGGFYKPDGLLDGLAPTVADAAANVVDLHLYTFNAVDATERWRKEFLARLAA